MTIYYPVDWQVNGGPPQENYCPGKFEDAWDDPTDAQGIALVTTITSSPEMPRVYIVDCVTRRILVDVPISHYHVAIHYLAEFMRKYYALLQQQAQADMRHAAAKGRKLQ